MENHSTYIPRISSLKPSFHSRSTLDEVMDDLEMEGEELEGALDQLEIINTWLGGNGVVLSGLKRMVRTLHLDQMDRPLRIVDLGCGGGDTLRVIAKWARKKRLNVELMGVDANDFTIKYAKNHSTNYPEITYKKADCFSPEFLTKSFDITLCSLFLHHFSDEDLQTKLKDLMKLSDKGIIINDLQRHWLPFYLFRLFTILLRSNPMVVYDGSLSIMRGFKRKEWEEKMQSLNPAFWSVKWKWAFRHQILIHC